MKLSFLLHAVKRISLLLVFLILLAWVIPAAAAGGLQVLSATPNWAGAEIASQIVLTFNQSIDTPTLTGQYRRCRQSIPVRLLPMRMPP